MEIEVTKTWQTIHFLCKKNGIQASVELTFNHDLNSFDIQSPSEEAVSFKRDSIEMAKLRLIATEQALNWVEKTMTVKEKRKENEDKS